MIPMKPYKLKPDDLAKLKYPVYVQPKFDGWRIIILEGKALTYQLKPIPNHYIRTSLEKMFKGVDHYLIDGEGLLMNDGATYQDIQSAYSTREGEPDFRYVMFDCLKTKQSQFNYDWRLIDLRGVFRKIISNSAGEYANKSGLLEIVQYYQYHCQNKLDIDSAEDWHVHKRSREGIIIRSCDGKYKFGRSTLKEGYLLALKRHIDAEARVIGYTPLKRNDNEMEFDNHGHAKRSSSKINKVSQNMLGALSVIGINGRFKGIEFEIGSGMTEQQRKDWFHSFDDEIAGKIVKYKYYEIGSKDKPRQPIFLGFRNEEEM